MMKLRFHWMLPKGGEVAVETPEATARFRTECTGIDSPARLPDMVGWVHFAKKAEEAGIDSVLISCGRYEPDAFLTACALGRETEKLKFIAAFRAGWMQPATLVQQTNTLSALIGGRISLNIVAGSSRTEQRAYGDFLSHDERYERAEEFLAICNSFWKDSKDVDFCGKHYRVSRGKLQTPFLAPDRKVPEIYVSGHSRPAERLARSQGTCWLRVVDTPENLRPLTRKGEPKIDVCIRLCLVCRATREEAVNAARALLPPDYVGKKQRPITSKDDSQMYREATTIGYDAGWVSRTVWAGLAPYYGPVWTALVGTPEELAHAFLAYKEIGVGQFIISGCPELDELAIFREKILPLVRDMECRPGKDAV